MRLVSCLSTSGRGFVSVSILVVSSGAVLASVPGWARDFGSEEFVPLPQSAQSSADPAPLLGCPIPGDLDGDCHVTIADLSILLADFGCGPPSGSCRGDINGDGYTALADLSILLSNYGV